MQQKSNHSFEKKSSPIIDWISDVFNLCIPLKNNITEIQWIFGLKFFQTDLNFVASEFHILFLQGSLN